MSAEIEQRLYEIDAEAKQLAVAIATVVSKADADAATTALVDVLAVVIVERYRADQVDSVLRQLRTLLHYDVQARVSRTARPASAPASITTH